MDGSPDTHASARALGTAGLLALARSSNPKDREKLLDAVTCFYEDASRDERATLTRQGGNDLLHDLLLELVREAEASLRQRMASRLKVADWAPHDLIVWLALDEIDIARPIIAESPLLQDQDLIRILVEATLEHRIEVARRPRLGSPVADAIMDQDHPLVLAALAGNASAEVSVNQLARMVAASKRVAAMRSPLSRHPGLTHELAYALYSWVGETLKAVLAERFQVDDRELGAMVDGAVSSLKASEDRRRGDRRLTEASSPLELFEKIAADPDPDLLDPASESRLLTKLALSGQLRPGLLLRALRERKMGLFKSVLARLGQFEPAQVEAALASGRQDLLALACAAVTIDRGAFRSIHGLVEDNLGRRVQASQALPGEISAAFAMTPEQARKAFIERVRRLSATDLSALEDPFAQP